MIYILFLAAAFIGVVVYYTNHPTDPPASSHRRGTQTADSSRRQSSRRPHRTNQQTRTSPYNERSALDARKVLSTAEFVLNSFGLPLPWSAPGAREKWLHDIAVFRQYRDLSAIKIELIDASSVLVFRHLIVFNEASDTLNFNDRAGGIELPLLPPGTVKQGRFLAVRLDREALYKHLLKLPWQPTANLGESLETRFASAHTERINGNRVKSEMLVSDSARVVATIQRVIEGGRVGFARHPTLPADVYLNDEFIDGSFIFRRGISVSFVPIQTPRGLQGRSIRLTD